MKINYKNKFYWAVAVAVIFFIILIGGSIWLIVRGTQKTGVSDVLGASQVDSRSMLPESDKRAMVGLAFTRPAYQAKASQNEWDYRPSKNPTYQQNTQIQQIGYITMEKTTPSEEPKILPLFGQSLRYKNSDRWSYFTATDQYQSIRLPVHYEKRDCMNDDVGCREISSNDIVQVPTYNDKNFTVTLYKNQLPHV